MAARTPQMELARSFLLQRKQRGVELGVDRMRRFLGEIGDPQQRLKCVHVAGTNGKGSVSAMIEAILRAAGWRTGLYTSPHLVRLGERVQVNRRPLSDDELVAAVDALRPVVERIRATAGEDATPSYFEFMTGLALRHFEQAGCDIAVIEVGLGGRLDATYLVLPELSVITSIGFDHCHLLGHRLGDIAREKAGIVKAGRPVVIGRLQPEAELAVREVADQQGSPLHSVREVCGDEVSRCPQTNLEGEYQRWNAATAALAVRALGARWKITEPLVELALRQVSWPARWQRFRAGGRDVIIDSSHNPEGAEVLAANLRRSAATWPRPSVFVVAALGKERAIAILAVACRYARVLHLVAPRQPRACTVEELRACVPAEFKGTVVESSVDELFPSAADCAAGELGDTVVVTGSMYLAGEVLAQLEPERGEPDHDLQDF